MLKSWFHKEINACYSVPANIAKCRYYYKKNAIEWLFFVVLICGITPTQAQQTLGTSLLGSAGGTAFSGSLGLTFSLGETVIDHTPAATFGVLQHDPQGLPSVWVPDIKSSELNLFPNPNRGNFQLTGVPEETASWEIFDSNGRQVASGLFQTPQIQLQQTVSQGLYLLRMLDAQGAITADRKFSILY